MLIEGKCAVIETVSCPNKPPHACRTCLLDSRTKARHYIQDTFTETLELDTEDHGSDAVLSSHASDWSYAKIQIPSYNITREFILSTIVHDPR